MKKIFFFSAAAIAVAALTTTGCSNNEQVEIAPSQARAIEFRVAGNNIPTTRATETTDSIGLDAFVVYGADDIGGATDLLFDGVTVARQKDGSFAYAPLRYYNDGAQNRIFIAYSPVSRQVTDFNAGQIMNSKVSFRYEVLHPDTLKGTSRQEDFLLGGDEFNPLAPNGKETIGFFHLLSRIFVKAKNESGETVVIKSLKLPNLYSKGLFTVDWYDYSDYGWSDYNTPIDYKFVLAETGVAVPSDTVNAPAKLVTSMEQGMLIIPQTVRCADIYSYTPGDFAIEVKYDQSNLKNQTKHIKLYPWIKYSFDSNEQYAITINFTRTGITFDIEVSEFETPVREP